MKDSTLVSEVFAAAGAVCRAQVILLQEDGSVLVQSADSEEDAFTCEILETSSGDGPKLFPTDPVLVWRSTQSDQRGVILGRIGPSHTARPEAATTPPSLEDEVPAELVIEAKHSLTLRVGSGSITIREDGKILIKGKDLVSHAQRLNRIKGGAVQIN